MIGMLHCVPTTQSQVIFKFFPLFFLPTVGIVGDSVWKNTGVQESNAILLNSLNTFLL